MFVFLGKIIGQSTSFSGGGNMQLSEFKKKGGWLYEASYNTLDYEYAKRYFDNRYRPAQSAGCSAVRNGNFFGRNFDWTYDEAITLVARSAPDENRYASVGVVGAVPGLTRSLAEGGSFSEAFMIAPFCLVDGINSEGLMCNINMLAPETSKGRTTGTIAAVEERERVCMLMLVRYVLDHYSSVDEAVADIRDYVSVYAPDSAAHSSEYHFMLADSTKTVILEFVENEMAVTEVGPEEDYPSIMMNFYADGVTVNSDGTITRNTSDDPDAENVNGVTPFGQGIERHNIAADGYSDASTLAGMKALMRSLFYTHAYTLISDNWFTEFVGEWEEELGGTLKVTSPDADFDAVIAAAAAKYAQRSRDPQDENYGTWQTVHSVVYDMAAKKLVVCVQEGTDYVEFGLTESAAGGSVDVQQGRGQSTTAVMSQKAVTDELTELEQKVSDREATETSMGYVLLDVSKTFAEQVTEENTIYEIRDSFDLDDESVDIPTGCILRFNGGELIGGTLDGSPFLIEGDAKFNGVSFGTSYILNDTILLDWFSFKADGETDDYANFKIVEKLFNNKGGGRLLFGLNRDYAVRTPLQHITNIYMLDESAVLCIKHCNSLDINLNGSTIVQLSSNTAASAILRFVDCVGKVHNGKLIGDREEHDYSPYVNYAGEESTDFEWNYGIYQQGGVMEFSELTISHFCGDGLIVGSAKYSSSSSYNGRYIISSCDVSYCGRNGITCHSAYGMNVIENTTIHHIGTYGDMPAYNPQAGIDCEFEDGLGNKPDLLMQNVKISDCTRRGISVAQNSAFSSFMWDGGVLENACLKLGNMITDYGCTLRHIFVKDNDDSAQTDATHTFNSGIILESCSFHNLRKITAWAGQMNHCEIITTSVLLDNNSVFPYSSSSYPAKIRFRDCGITVNVGLVEFYNMQFNDCKVQLNGISDLRLAAFDFIDGEFISDGTTNVGANQSNKPASISENVTFAGTLLRNIAGTQQASLGFYSTPVKEHFYRCTLEGVTISSRRGRVLADNCTFTDCIIYKTSGVDSGADEYSNCIFFGCGGRGTGAVDFINCNISDDRAVRRDNVLGLSCYSSATKDMRFIGCNIHLINFIIGGATYDHTFSSYENCTLDIANASLDGAMVINSIVKSTVANKATQFISSTYILNGVITPATRGATAERPTLTADDAGFEFYDSDLLKKILWNGTSWVNVDGSSLTSS